jgi:hypothetical protein
MLIGRPCVSEKPSVNAPICDVGGQSGWGILREHAGTAAERSSPQRIRPLQDPDPWRHHRPSRTRFSILAAERRGVFCIPRAAQPALLTCLKQWAGPFAQGPCLPPTPTPSIPNVVANRSPPKLRRLRAVSRIRMEIQRTPIGWKICHIPRILL